MTTHDLVARLGESRDAVLEHRALDATRLAATYRRGGWSVRALLAHLADAELIGLWRFGAALAAPGSRVEAFDQAAWAAAGDYGSRDAEASCRLFAACRTHLIDRVEATSDDLLDSGWAEHPEKGRVPARLWADIADAHARHHIGQIRAALDGTPWRPVETATSWMFTGGARPPRSAR